MQEKNWRKFPLLFNLYIAQSIPMSFFSTVVPVILRQEHYSLQSIGMLQLLKLPWILKFIWAPMVDDKTADLRQLRKWIIASEMFYAFVILIIGFFSLQTDFTLILVLLFVAFIASGTQDIATDAYAILLLKPSERGFGNSIQSAGSFIGTLFGTGVLLIAYHYFGWSKLVYLLALFVIIALIPLLLNRKEQNIIKSKPQKVGLQDVFSFFGQKGAGKRILLLTFCYSGIIGILTMLKPFLVDQGFNVKQIGFMSGIVGTACAAISAFVAGYVIKKIGIKKTLFLFVTFTIISTSYFTYISYYIPTLLQNYIGIIAIWSTYGFATVAVYTYAMNHVRSGREGTDFTLQIVLTHLSSMIIAVLSGKLGDIYGYKGIFRLEVVLSLLTLLIVFYAFPKYRENESSRNTDTEV